MTMTFKVDKSCVFIDDELWFLDKAVLNIFELCGCHCSSLIQLHEYIKNIYRHFGVFESRPYITT